MAQWTVGEPVVLLIQDTTELNYTRRRQKMSELGALNDENSAGMCLHAVWAVTPGRRTLGLVAARMWTRTAEEFGKKHRRKQRVFEEKESVRWRDGYQRACEVAGRPHSGLHAGAGNGAAPGDGKNRAPAERWRRRVDGGQARGKG